MKEGSWCWWWWGWEWQKWKIHSSRWIKRKSCVNTEIAGRIYTLVSGLGIVSFDFTEETVTDLVDP